MTENELFNSLYRRTKPCLMRYVSRRVLGDASEIVDEIYLTAWRKRSDIPENHEEQLMWLYAIGRRTIANTVRWRSRLDRFNRSTNRLAETTVRNDSSETTILVHECLSRLKKTDREILLLVEWDECSVTEAAGILEITEAAATKRLKYARDSFIELYSASQSVSSDS